MAKGRFPTLATLVRVVVGGLFIFAGVSKLLDPVSFLNELTNYQLLPSLLLPGFTWFLPTLETVLGVCLVGNFWKREVCALMLVLMTLFTLSLIYAWQRGLNVTCGCFGSFALGDSYPFWIGRDLLLLAAIAYLMRAK